MENEIQNLKLNNRLVKRQSDFCFFDADKFKLYKLNADGFEILCAIADGEFHKIDFNDKDVIAFIDSCRTNKILEDGVFSHK